jgi:hypothetical protein
MNPEKVELDGPQEREVVLYMLHCGLDGKVLEEVCRQYGLKLHIHQFPREELFAYHMHTKRKAPDLILIRGHFISLTHNLDSDRHIPYVVVSSKLKYGDGQPVFIHAEKGYDQQNTLSLYQSLARTIKAMVESRNAGSGDTASSEEQNDVE